MKVTNLIQHAVTALALVPAIALANEAESIERARAIVIKDFKDPGSAQFRDEFAFLPGKPRFENDYAVCGEVNAKNSYGGYVGFRKFYVLADKPVIEDPSEKDGFSLMMWNMVCKPHKPSGDSN